MRSCHQFNFFHWNNLLYIDGMCLGISKVISQRASEQAEKMVENWKE